jgi:hypothetical protein
MKAAMTEQVEALEILLQRGANVNVKDNVRILGLYECVMMNCSHSKIISLVGRH